MMGFLRSPAELAIMRRAGRLVADTLQMLVERVVPGVSTAQIDIWATEFITERGAVPSFKGYQGFPASVCTSINEEIIHGIPGYRTVKDGDVLSLDLGVIWDGFQGDSALTIGVGKVSTKTQKLIKVTRIALVEGIRFSKIGNRVGDISWAIQRYAERCGYEVIREYTGHGIGRDMHEEPQFPNYGRPGRGKRIKGGMVFALEPMLTMGTWKTCVLEDGWTVVTQDKRLAAHFEHTIAVTEDGPEILTLRDSGDIDELM